MGDKRQETRGKEMNGSGPCEKNGLQHGAERRKEKKK